MPNITFSYADFQNLLGRKLPMPQFEEELLLYAKAEVEKYDKKTDEITVNLDDTNLPYLWSVEGLARLFRNIHGLHKGAAELKAKKGSYEIIIDSSVRKVRPFLTAFVATGKKIDDYVLKQLVQFQEKFCEGYGRRRQKTSVGLYSYKRIKFPLHYKAVPPQSVKFIPLGAEKALNLSEILERHPKGQQYAWILKDAASYPIIMDSAGQVLSFPPIINSNFTGRLETGDSELLFEATGTDEVSVNLAANILAQNLQERGFTIYTVTVKYGGTRVVSPPQTRQSVNVSAQEVKRVTGLSLTQAQIAALLRKAGYDVTAKGAIIPPYRADIMHKVDVIEDIAIAYGFDRIPGEPLRSYTLGKKHPSINAINTLRNLAVGLGFQEIFGHILADRNALVLGMGFTGAAAAGKLQQIIVLENFMSETYSSVRDSLLPGLLDVLSKNKHEDYPQKVFEEGIIALRGGSNISESHSFALASAHSKADFTELKQGMTALLLPLGKSFSIKPVGHPTFLKGRCGSVIVNGKEIGIIGELNPAVLSRLGIDMPVSAAEINLSALIGF